MAKERLKVALYVFGKNHSIDKYHQILSLFRVMRDSPAMYDVCILTDGTSTAVKDILATTKDNPCDTPYEVIDLRDNDINNLDLSFILTIDPYNKPYVPFNEIKVPIVYKEYGVSGVENGAGYLLNKDIYKYADCIITDNEYMSQMIKSKYPGKRVIVGSPAFDYIFDSSYQKEDPRFDAHYRHVLWTPHHSIVKKDCYDKIVGGTYSTFLTYKDYFANQFLEDFEDVVLHVKPHPLLRGRYNYSFGKFNDYLNSFSDPSRVVIHEKEDYHPLFLHSDLIINDSISFIQEWLPTGKPMIILQDEKKTPYSPYGEELISKCYYKVDTPRELRDTVRTLLQCENSRKFTKRKEFIRSLYLQETGHDHIEPVPNCASVSYELYRIYRY